MIFLDGESDQKISSYANIPGEFFEDMESSWKGRVKKIHIEEEVAEVERAAETLSSVVCLLWIWLCWFCTLPLIATQFAFFYLMTRHHGLVTNFIEKAYELVLLD